MSRAANLRRALWIVVAAWAGSSTGCIHNHYYGTALPGCPPVGQSLTTQQVGSICDVPSGQVIVTNPSSPSRTISSNVTPQPPTQGASIASKSSPGVVISQPSYGPPSIGQSSGRFKWRKPDPEAPPVLKAEGGLEDSTLR
jgi:hypothetical protein